MSRTGISFEEFEGAIKALSEQGSNLTIKSIRDYLGKGSPNTIQRYLTEYKGGKSQQVISSETHAEPVPESIIRAIQQEFYNKLKNTESVLKEEIKVLNENNNLLSKESEQITAEYDAMEQELARVKLINEQLEAKSNMAEQKAQEQLELIESLKKELSEQTFKALSAQAVLAEVKNSDESNKSTIARLNIDLEQLKIDLAKREVRYEEQANRLKTAEEKSASLEKQVLQLEEERGTLQKQLTEAMVMEARSAEIAKSREIQLMDLKERMEKVQQGYQILPNPESQHAENKSTKGRKSKATVEATEPEEKDPRQLEIAE